MILWRNLIGRSNLIMVLPAILLAGYIAFLIGKTYLTQTELQTSTLKNFRQDLEKRAAALSYFYAERRDDLKNLAQSRELSIFFENQALGMSMTYGLRASLIEIQKRFSNLRHSKKLGQDPIYTQIIFLDTQGKCLVDSHSTDRKTPYESDWIRFLTPGYREPHLLVQRRAQEIDVILSIPYFFKDVYAGQILAWIFQPTVEKHLIARIDEFSHQLVQVFSYEGDFFLPVYNAKAPLLPFDPPEVTNENSITYKRFVEESPDHPPEEMIALWAPVQSTKFCLVGTWPAKEVFGHLAPWHLLVALGSFSVLLLGGVGVIWRSQNRNLILHTRLDEAARRQEIIEGKNLQLQELIAERQRAQKKMQLAKEAAEAANLAKSEFLANMSHEIRTPMNAIIGMSEVFRSTKIDPKQQEYLNIINSSARFLLALLNDILDLSKIEAGKLELERTDFQLSDILENMADMFRDKTLEKSLELIIATKGHVPGALIGDPTRLRQVLVNLTSNAIKFTEQGEILIQVSCLESSSTEVELAFSVKDSGVGISAENQQKIFEAFTQADGSTTRRYGGTGLGLTISRRLVELMQGKIWVESELGKGSTFHFSIPFDRQPPDREKVFALPPDLRGLKILLVDDNETCRLVMRNMVESFGFQVELASSGAEALTKIRDHNDEENYFGMVLLDWRIPDMDGISIAKKIKQDPHYSGVPIIMITAFGREEEMNQAEQAGIADFLVKPVKQSMLFDTIMNVFSDKAFQTSGMFSSRQNIVRESPLIEPLGPFHVLLVEDIYVNQLVVKEMLRSSGLHLQMANNGKEALDMLEHASFDLVLMDIQMPEMDGIEATRQIRRDQRLQKLPIIAMTAHAMKSDRENCLQAGMDDYITKPVDPNQLYAILKKWLPTAPQDKHQLSKIEFEKEDSEEFILPQKLAGIEVTAALQRLNGNRKLFIQILQSFSQKFASVIPEIRDAWCRDDFKQMHYLVHTLKGTAGNIAANDLQAAALNLERAVKDVDRNVMENLLMELERSLDEVLQSSQGYLTDMTRASSLQNRGDQEGEVFFDEPLKNKLLPLFNKLMVFIQEKDPVGSQDVVNLLIEQLDGKRLPQEFEKILTEIDNFQFEAALKSLADFLGNLGVPLDSDN